MCISNLHSKGEKARKKTRRVYVGFMDLEKLYDRVEGKLSSKYCKCMMWTVNF